MLRADGEPAPVCAWCMVQVPTVSPTRVPTSVRMHCCCCCCIESVGGHWAPAHFLLAAPHYDSSPACFSCFSAPYDPAHPAPHAAADTGGQGGRRGTTGKPLRPSSPPNKNSMASSRSILNIYLTDGYVLCLPRPRPSPPPPPGAHHVPDCQPDPRTLRQPDPAAHPTAHGAAHHGLSIGYGRLANPRCTRQESGQPPMLHVEAVSIIGTMPQPVTLASAPLDRVPYRSHHDCAGLRYGQWPYEANKGHKTRRHAPPICSSSWHC